MTMPEPNFYIQVQKCSGCGKQGHNRRRCTTLTSLHVEEQLLTELAQRITTALSSHDPRTMRRVLHIISQRTIDYY